MQPIGIRPTNDFAFKKTFGSPENKVALISLLNAILNLPTPIMDVTIENPFNLQDFKEDKLSILDIRAVDQLGAIYDIEMQLSAYSGLAKRIVFYGCEVYAGQLKAGDDYSELKPVYSICLLQGRLWHDSPKVHHAFRLVDRDSGRLLEETLEIHTLELGWYNLKESELETASLLDRWLYWLLHAHQYDAQTLSRLFPQPEFQKATDSIDRIARKTEDKAMYDTREKALRDQQWILNAVKREAREEGEIRLIQTLQEILGVEVSDESSLQGKSIDELQTLTAELRDQIKKRN
jgi:predicted transposase/invertase (TIGR01784 family)